MALAALTFRRMCSVAAPAKGREYWLLAAEHAAKRPPAAAEDDEASGYWVPDPATGYYRPANKMGEIDPVELREILLGRSNNKA